MKMEKHKKTANNKMWHGEKKESFVGPFQI